MAQQEMICLVYRSYVSALQIFSEFASGMDQRLYLSCLKKHESANMFKIVI
jgi:hypothetical protein